MEHQQSVDSATLSPIKYVDELAGEDDYWLSITDAARATRRQDVTIRTWIAKGTLPVRRRSVGLNKRTRQVRVSDLRQLTEIIDPTAVITSEQGKLDLMSIPAQQQQILAEYKRVSTQMDTLLEQLEDSAATLNQTLTEHHTTSSSALTQLHNTLTAQQEQTQETLVHLLTTLSTTTIQQQETQGILFKAVEAGNIQLDRHGLQLTEQQETAHTYQTILLNHFTQQNQQIEAAQGILRLLQTQLVEQSTALGHYAQEMNTRSQQQTRLLQTLEQQITTTTTQLAQHLDTTQETIIQHLEAIQNTILLQLNNLTKQQEVQENEMHQAFTTFTQSITQQLSILLAPLSQQLTASSEQQAHLFHYVQTALTQKEQQGLFPDLPSGGKKRRTLGKE